MLITSLLYFFPTKLLLKIITFIPTIFRALRKFRWRWRSWYRWSRLLRWFAFFTINWRNRCFTFNWKYLSYLRLCSYQVLDFVINLWFFHFVNFKILFLFLFSFLLLFDNYRLIITIILGQINRFIFIVNLRFLLASLKIILNWFLFLIILLDQFQRRKINYINLIFLWFFIQRLFFIWLCIKEFKIVNDLFMSFLNV